MLKKHNFEGKSYEEAIEKCKSELELDESELYIKTTEIEGKLFKSSRVELEVIKKSDVKEYIKDFINTITENMGLDVKIEVTESDEIFNVVLVSEENGILIGKDGRTLNAIQLLLRQSLQIETDNSIKVNVDAGNYKAKKIRNFEYEMKKVIREVSKTKVEAKLDPMNSYQRRIIHNLANSFDNITTHSEGEGKERHVIIQYKED